MTTRIVIGVVCAFLGIQVGTWNGHQVERRWSAGDVQPLDTQREAVLLAAAPATSPSTACQMVQDGLQRADWPPVLVPTMVAIAEAESGCRPDALRVTLRERSVGALQLNLHQHPWISDWCAKDSICAARAALRIFRAQGFLAWTAYRTGAYREYMDD